jgi:hypothetical protein
MSNGVVFSDGANGFESGAGQLHDHLDGLESHTQGPPRPLLPCTRFFTSDS